MKLRAIVAAGALVAAGAANASLDNFATGNSSLAFVAIDNVGTTVGSLVVNLGYHLNDFIPTAAFNGPDQTVVWNFGTNTVTVNGSAVNLGTNDWSAAFNTAIAGTDAADLKWGVIAGDSTSIPQRILTTGTPTASQLTQENASATAGALGVNGLYNNTAAAISSSATNAAYATTNSSDPAYAALGTNFGATNNWQNKLKWLALTNGSQNNFWEALGNGAEQQVAKTSTYDTSLGQTYDSTGLLNGNGTFTFDATAKTLTWKTAATVVTTPTVPEPESYMLMGAGLAAVGFVARRRAAR